MGNQKEQMMLKWDKVNICKGKVIFSCKTIGNISLTEKKELYDRQYNTNDILLTLEKERMVLSP